MIITRHEEPDQSHYYIAAERDFNGANVYGANGQRGNEQGLQNKNTGAKQYDK